MLSGIIAISKLFIHYLPTWFHDSLEYTATIEVAIRAGNFTQCVSAAR